MRAWAHALSGESVQIMMGKDEEVMKLKNDLPMKPKTAGGHQDRFENTFLTSMELSKLFFSSRLLLIHASLQVSAESGDGRLQCFCLV